MENLTALLGAYTLFFILILLWLGIMIPWFVWRIKVYTKKTWQESATQTALIRKICEKNGVHLGVDEDPGYTPWGR